MLDFVGVFGVAVMLFIGLWRCLLLYDMLDLFVGLYCLLVLLI